MSKKNCLTNKNWEQENKPHIIPLAGIIRQNKGGLGVNDYTNKNFSRMYK